MNKNNFILNRLFTRNIFEKLLKYQTEKVYNSIISQYCSDDIEEKNIELLKNIYRYMSKNYRNEYFYQNTLFNKLLLGRHSLNTTVALTQVPVGKAKADFIMINGKAVVYEIKTELDSFDRLKNQIENYYKGFNSVCVVTCEKNLKKLLELLEDTKIGVYVLTDKKNTLSLKKEIEENNDFLDYEVIFKYLRKKEFENILIKYFKELPKVPPVFYYTKCLEWIKKIEITVFYNLAIKELKKRNDINKELFNEIPYELKSLVYFYNPSVKEYYELNNFLKNEYRG